MLIPTVFMSWGIVHCSRDCCYNMYHSKLYATIIFKSFPPKTINMMLTVYKA